MAKHSSSIEEKENCRMIFKRGSIVERIIEGEWFIGEVIDTDEDEFTIRYLDDNNVEKYVHKDELRLAANESLTTVKSQKKSTLPKPLMGLVDDDSDERLVHTPKTTLHNDSEIGKTTKHTFLHF